MAMFNKMEQREQKKKQKETLRLTGPRYKPQRSVFTSESLKKTAPQVKIEIEVEDISVTTVPSNEGSYRGGSGCATKRAAKLQRKAGTLLKSPLKITKAHMVDEDDDFLSCQPSTHASPVPSRTHNL